MLYYVYYDAYGHARKAIAEEVLNTQYKGSIDEFFKAMCTAGENEEMARATGHVGTLRFLDLEELEEFLDSLGDEISDFYDCEHGSRPYNF